jgi:hypothetical protein
MDMVTVAFSMPGTKRFCSDIRRSEQAEELQKSWTTISRRNEEKLRDCPSADTDNVSWRSRIKKSSEEIKRTFKKLPQVTFDMVSLTFISKLALSKQ